MTCEIFTQAPSWRTLQEALSGIAQQLNAGLDVAPGQRLRLEGLAAALMAEGVPIEELERACLERAGERIAVVRTGDMLHFDCRQQRAPVYPTTSD